MSTLFIAGCLIGFIVLVVAFLQYVHKRELKKDALKKENIS